MRSVIMYSYAVVLPYMDAMIMALKQVVANQLQKKKFSRRLGGHTLSTSISIYESMYVHMGLWNAAVLPLCPLSSSLCCLLIYTGPSPTAPWFLPLVHDSKPWILPDPSGITVADTDRSSNPATTSTDQGSVSIAAIKNSSSE
jgi:hypothetical protein